MPRLMSCALTKDAVRNRTKTVTRRAAHAWKTLKPGDRLTLVEKGMGLAKGEKVRRLAEVEVTDVRVEPLFLVRDPGECAAEGFPNMTPLEFAAFWCLSHKEASPLVDVRRIEWRYVETS